MRIFCANVPACKRALIFLIQALRRRGLNLQTAKTEIVSADVARNTISGIAPIIAEVQEKYRGFLEAMMESVGPYATISEMEANVSPDDPPVEVVREAFKNIFVEADGPFSKTLFHYLLNRLGSQEDAYALKYCLEQFSAHPEETDAILEYVYDVDGFKQAFPALEAFLNSADCIYDFQIYKIFDWLFSRAIVPSEGLVAIARRLTFDNARPGYLRAACRGILQTHGTMADLHRLEDSYGQIHEELEKAQVLISLKRIEVGRRNSFYGRVGRDGMLCERAVKLVKEDRL